MGQKDLRANKQENSTSKKLRTQATANAITKPNTKKITC